MFPLDDTVQHKVRQPYTCFHVLTHSPTDMNLTAIQQLEYRDVCVDMAKNNKMFYTITQEMYFLLSLMVKFNALPEEGLTSSCKSKKHIPAYRLRQVHNKTKREGWRERGERAKAFNASSYAKNLNNIDPQNLTE